ncbi:MAG: hypothetical protein AB7N76_27475 [Planctomycetota bacterium]
MSRTLSLALVMALCLTAGADARPNLSGKEFNQHKKDAEKALRAGQFSAAATELAALGKDDSKRAIEFLCSIAKVPDAETYDAAMQAIAAMRSEEAQDTILKRLKAGGSPVGKMLLVDAMAERNDDFAGEALGAAVTDKTPEVQRAAISAIKRKKLKQAIPGLIELLSRLEKKEADGLNFSLVQETLTAITNESFEKAEDWGKYWETAKASFRPVTGAPTKEPGGTQRRQRPRFFGSEIKSDRIVFVIDTSGSMTAADPGGPVTTGGNGGGQPRTPTGQGGQEPPKNPGAESRVRIERAKYQLMQVIDALPARARFTILAYSGVIVSGPGAEPPKDGLMPPKMGGFEWLKIWSPNLMVANEKSKSDAKAFVKGLQANGGTFTLNALKHAFKVQGADTVVVLSDGYPNDHDLKLGRALNGDEILKEVAAMNRMRRLVIDTFGFDSSDGEGARFGGGGRRRGGGGNGGGTGGGPGGGGPLGGGGFGGGGASDLSGFMKQLAGQNGGSYTQIK